ncbi:DUF6300 family protein [Streptomyces sp. NPDC057757]
MELCGICDADRTAASVIVSFFATGGSHGLSRW